MKGWSARTTASNKYHSTHPPKDSVPKHHSPPLCPHWLSSFGYTEDEPHQRCNEKNVPGFCCHLSLTMGTAHLRDYLSWGKVRLAPMASPTLFSRSPLHLHPILTVSAHPCSVPTCNTAFDEIILIIRA